jgi:hypothetical protein
VEQKTAPLPDGNGTVLGNGAVFCTTISSSSLISMYFTFLLCVLYLVVLSAMACSVSAACSSCPGCTTFVLPSNEYFYINPGPATPCTTSGATVSFTVSSNDTVSVYAVDDQGFVLFLQGAEFDYVCECFLLSFFFPFVICSVFSCPQYTAGTSENTTCLTGTTIGSNRPYMSVFIVCIAVNTCDVQYTASYQCTGTAMTPVNSKTDVWSGIYTSQGLCDKYLTLALSQLPM